MATILWTFEPRGIEAAMQALEASLQDAKGPSRAASRATGRWVRKYVSQRVKAMTGLSSAAMRRRFRIYDSYSRADGTWEVRAWFGTKPLSLFQVDAKVSSSGGIRTKTKSWPRGFVMTWQGKKLAVQRVGPRRMVNGRRRQDLEVLRVPIHEHVTYALRVARRKAQDVYLQVFMEKLRQQMAREAMSA